MDASLQAAHRGLALSIQPLTGDAMRGKLTEFNERAAAVLAPVRDAEERLRTALAGVGEEAQASDVYGATQSIEMATLDAAQRCCELWRERSGLAKDAAADLAEHIDPAQEELEAVRQKTTEVLATVGISPTSVIAAGNNLDGAVNSRAAETQFAVILNQASPVREAARHADAAKRQHAAAIAAVGACRSGVERAKTAAKKLANKVAAVAVA